MWLRHWIELMIIPTTMCYMAPPPLCVAPPLDRIDDYANNYVPHVVDDLNLSTIKIPTLIFTTITLPHLSHAYIIIYTHT